MSSLNQKLVLCASTILRWWWLLAAFVAAASLFAFPVYKNMLVGLAPVAIGILIAGGLHFLPQNARNLMNAVLFEGKSGKWIITLTVLAFAVRVPVILFPSIPFSDHLTYYVMAKGLAGGSGYGSSLLYPPGQPTWLSLWVRLIGDSVRGLVLVQCVLSTLAVPLIYIAVRRHQSERAARWAALATAFFPSIILWAGTLGHETTVIFLQAAILALLAIASDKTGWRAVCLWATLGCLGGLTALVRPTYLFLPVIVAVSLWLRKTEWRRLIPNAVVAGLCLAATIAPWAWRNYQKFDGICLVSANFGRVLLSANHPKSDGIFYHTADIGAGLNTIAKDRLQRDLAMQAIRDNPKRFGQLALKKLVYMWGTDTSVLDFVLGEPPRGGSRTKAGLSAIMQIVWSWFVCAWCIGAARSISKRYDLSVVEYSSICWALLLWITHAILEPLSRHHVPVIPLIAMMSLESYWEWVNAPARAASPVMQREAAKAAAV